MRVEASFLTVGESYAFDVPDEFDPHCELYGVVGRADHQRYIVYRPRTRENPDVGRPLKRLRDIPTGEQMLSGLQMVSVYQPLDVPKARVAYWRLPTAFVFTFVDQRTGPFPDQEIQTVIESVSMTTTKVGLPKIDVTDPIVFGNHRDPRHRDRIEFLPRVLTPNHGFVSIWREPTWVLEGNSRRDGDGWSARAVTNELHLTVEVVGPESTARDLERQARRIAASAVPLD